MSGRPKLHRNAEAVRRALREAGASGEVRELDASTRTAADAAAALGCPVGAIANSLVFVADDLPILVLASGAHRVDTDHLAARIGAGVIRRATADEVREATGQPIGGVAPLGHPRPLRTFVDAALEEFAVLWAAAGTPKAVFPTGYEELIRLCAGTPVSVVPSG